MDVKKRNIGVGMLCVLGVLAGCDTQVNTGGGNKADSSAIVRDNLLARAVNISSNWQTPEVVYAEDFSALYPDTYLHIGIEYVGSGALLATWGDNFPTTTQMFAAKNASQNSWQVLDAPLNQHFWQERSAQFPENSYRLSVWSDIREVVLMKYDAQTGWAAPLSLHRVSQPQWETGSIGFVHEPAGNTVVQIGEASGDLTQYLTVVVDASYAVSARHAFNPPLAGSDKVFDMKFAPLGGGSYLAVWVQGELGGMATLASAVFDTHTGWSVPVSISNTPLYWSSSFSLSRDSVTGSVNVVATDSRTGLTQYLSHANSQWSESDSELLSYRLSMATNQQGDIALAWYTSQLDSASNTVNMTVNAKVYTHGAGWGEVTRLTSFTGQPDMWAPAVHIADTGEIRVGWNTTQTLEVAAYNIQTDWSPVEAVAIMMEGYVLGRYLGITSDAAGKFYLVWQEYRANGQQVSSRLYLSSSI